MEEGAGVVTFCLPFPNTALIRSATPPFACTTSAIMPWVHFSSVLFLSSLLTVGTKQVSSNLTTQALPCSRLLFFVSAL